jgi:hypothetical protein
VKPGVKGTNGVCAGKIGPSMLVGVVPAHGICFSATAGAVFFFLLLF